METLKSLIPYSFIIISNLFRKMHRKLLLGPVYIKLKLQTENIFCVGNIVASEKVKMPSNEKRLVEDLKPIILSSSVSYLMKSNSMMN